MFEKNVWKKSAGAAVKFHYHVSSWSRCHAPLNKLHQQLSISQHCLLLPHWLGSGWSLVQRSGQRSESGALILERRSCSVNLAVWQEERKEGWAALPTHRKSSLNITGLWNGRRRPGGVIRPLIYPLVGRGFVCVCVMGGAGFLHWNTQPEPSAFVLFVPPFILSFLLCCFFLSSAPKDQSGWASGSIPN